MFTGIVETVGTVTVLEALDKTEAGGGGTSLTISNVNDILSDAHLGDSICINGTCLTITEFDSKAFKVGISPETLRRTNLGTLKERSNVNLERAILPSTRLGGHFLQGHVDTTARILEKRPDGNAITFRLAPRDQSVLRHVVEKGYIALDGASLTITTVTDPNWKDEGWFEVMLIAYTQERVVMAAKGPGEEVNVEVDMVGKYVEKNVASYFEGKGSSGNIAVLEKIINRVVDEKLSSK